MECLSYSIAKSIDINSLETKLLSDSSFKCTKMRHVIKLQRDDGALGFIFFNGSVVTWGLKRYEANDFINHLMSYLTNPLTTTLHDEFSYRLGEKTIIKPHDYFDVDCLTLEDNDVAIKLSLSYGFAQSVKLQYFENTLEVLIEKYTPLISELSQTGRMRVSRKETRCIIGEILATKSELNLISNFMYHPKYFWQHPTHEIYFSMLEEYMDIPRRIKAINHRIDTLNEVFDMFSSYLENKHSHGLEIIIIVLIAVEIILALLNIHV